MRILETAINNLLKALEQGQSADIITNRLQERTEEKISIEAQIAVERLNNGIDITEEDVRKFMLALKRGDINDIKCRRVLIYCVRRCNLSL